MNNRVVPQKASIYAWYITIVLCLAQLVSVVDRYTMSIVSELVRKDLTLTDAQLGILFGPSFVLLFAFGSLPAGWLADRVNRKWLIFSGITAWSLANAACGLAATFEQLMVARLFVGLGEALLVPAAMSLIAAYFPPQSLYRATSVMLSGASLEGQRHS